MEHRVGDIVDIKANGAVQKGLVVLNSLDIIEQS
jgi:ribosomal protein L21E